MKRFQSTTKQHNQTTRQPTKTTKEQSPGTLWEMFSTWNYPTKSWKQLHTKLEHIAALVTFSNQQQILPTWHVWTLSKSYSYQQRQCIALHWVGALDISSCNHNHVHVHDCFNHLIYDQQEYSPIKDMASQESIQRHTWTWFNTCWEKVKVRRLLRMAIK